MVSRMRVLYLGVSGSDVGQWQQFLRGIDPRSEVEVNYRFDQVTVDATKTFQIKCGFSGGGIDGVVGNNTMGKALLLGYHGMMDNRTDKSAAGWPAKPSQGPLSYYDREKVFNSFQYVASPSQGNPEGITISGDWVQKNMGIVVISQLSNVVGAPKNCNILFNNIASKQLTDLFLAWESLGLLDRILTWGGSWNPRFIRGSRSILSNHAWGTAFDINVQWNMLGTTPAFVGQKGCVRELVETAYEYGFYWGGWFQPRIDAMHFEIYKII